MSSHVFMLLRPGQCTYALIVLLGTWSYIGLETWLDSYPFGFWSV